MDYPNKLKFGPQFKILGCLLERPSIGLTLGSFIVGVFGASCFWKWLDGFTSLNWVSIYFLTFSPAGKFLQGCTCRGRSCGTPLWTLIHLIHLFSCFSYHQLHRKLTKIYRRFCLSRVALQKRPSPKILLYFLIQRENCPGSENVFLEWPNSARKEIFWAKTFLTWSFTLLQYLY